MYSNFYCIHFWTKEQDTKALLLHKKFISLDVNILKKKEKQKIINIIFDACKN